MKRLLILIAGLLACRSFSRATADPIAIGSRLEPFVDGFLIDRMEGARLQIGSPRPAEEVLAFDKPWEGRYCGYVTVLCDGDLYRMYYRGLPVSGADGSDGEVTCYAESRDGIHWTKPNLGLFEVAGTRENNVILAAMPPFSHNFAPFLDVRPAVAPDARFKALAGTSKSGLVAFASADGLHWRKLRDEPVITHGAFDSQNVAFWSAAEAKYLCYLRTWTERDGGFRTISRSESTDFAEWSEPREMEFGGAPMEHLYTNQTRPYFRAPHLYVATAARFMPGRRVISESDAARLGGEASYSGDCSDTVLLTSRGANHYDRTFMEGFVRPGIGLGNWTSRTNYPACGIVPTGETEMSLYIQKNYGQPTHHLQRYALRLDGLSSIHAGYASGEVITKPLTFEGSTLILNYSTSAAGGIRVEIQDEERNPIPNFRLEDSTEIIGDEIEHPARWKPGADVSPLSGHPIRLRFSMKDADLFSIRFAS